METRSNEFLGTEKIGRLMRRFAAPCVVSLLVGALYNIVDQIFIANADYLGSVGNAANTVVFPMTVVALAIATMLGDGCCAFVSLRLGEKNERDARRGVGATVTALVLSSLLLTAVYLLFMDPILTLFGARVSAETFRLSREYFFYIALGVPFYMFGQALNPIVRSDGSPRFAMVSLLAGALTNCVLDPLFIYGFRWGMMGAAVATVAGQVISALMALWYLFRMKAVRLDRDCFRPRWSVLGKILPLGMTSFLSQISIVISMAAVLNMVKQYGALDPVFGQEQYAQIPTAVIGIVMKFFQIVMSVAIGLAAGCIPIVGYNMGAGNGARVQRVLVRLMLAEALAGLVATVIFEVFPLPLIGVFGAASESVYYTQFAVFAIRVFLSMTVLSCVNKGAFIFLQSMGRAWSSTALSTLREIVFGVGLPLILPRIWGLYGILYFMPAADVLTAIAAAFVLVRAHRDLEKVAAPVA